MNGELNTRRPKIDLSLLDSVIENSSWEHSYYLDRETGDILMVTDETQLQLEQIYEENTGEEDDDAGIEPILARLEMPDWEKEGLREADQVERDFGARHISIPHADSDEAYSDMVDFIATVQNRRLQDRLTQAIAQHRPFRRFKDILEGDPEERERWFSFSNGRICERTPEWLRDEGIEPI
ncbi:MAG: hypothetical protein HY667_04140 [Chloroflexi bacterium]|nr:hypothetical protein [Chloroflexota bacterium]